MAQRHVVQRLHPTLADVLSQLDGTPLGRALNDRAVELATSQVLGDPIDRSAALAGHRWLLERADGDGLPLTAAGYLKPAAVRELAAVLPTMHDWPFGLAKEVDAHPLLHFHGYLKSIGLLRRYKGTLRLTKAGRAAQQDPALLWQHLADALVSSDSPFEETTGVVMLVHAATSADDIDVDVVARTMAELGWRVDDGSSVERRDVYPVWNQLWDALGNVGAPVTRSVMDRALSPAARALVADALFKIVENEAHG
ncbi:hypothetical protein [Agrococcus baldri]|nr:hypothetical protein [Agrococcus baldri]